MLMFSVEHWFFLFAAVTCGVASGIVMAFGIMKTWPAVATNFYVGLILGGAVLLSIFAGIIIDSGLVTMFAIISILVVFLAYLVSIQRRQA